MGSSSEASSGVSPEFRAAFSAGADAGGAMSFAHFMELALYHPLVGYYRRTRPRVGYQPGTDFFTSSSSGAVFGEMVVSASVALLRAADRDPGTHEFVEIGAEPERGVIGGVAHPFPQARTVQVGEPIELTGDCVVFSNELFDAQPFVRTVFRDGAWRELGVKLDGNTLVEVELPSAFGEPVSVEGYHFDRPLAATALAETIARQSWRGLFLAIDYGKTLHELTTACPQGTARAYYRHTQSNDLLAHPGEQDLTCHVCWDWLVSALQQHGFAAPCVDFQETFFIRHAEAYLRGAVEADAAHLSRRKLAMLQLLHAGHLGQKFQVLHALR